MKEQNIAELEKIARDMRIDIIKMLAEAKSGHPGGSLSAVEIVACLYFGNIMKHNAADPAWPERDRFILSKGHAAPVLYAALAQAEYFPHGELMTLRKLHSRLQGHPDNKKLAGVEVATGSLGQGLSISAGMALGLRLNAEKNQGKIANQKQVATTQNGEHLVEQQTAAQQDIANQRQGEHSSEPQQPQQQAAANQQLGGQQDAHRLQRVFTLMGDGEIEEGQVWEAAMFAAHYKLDNLIAIVDNNSLQIDGNVENVAGLNNISAKFAAFGWQTIELEDGNNIKDVLTALKAACMTQGKPTVIVAHTTKGKGVSFMENEAGWHGKAPNTDQAAQALAELEEVSA